MPIRLPQADAIRHAIAERAAEGSAGDADYFLGLIGPVEPTLGFSDCLEAGWRLVYYQGTREEHDAIERAVGQVRRQTPLMWVSRASSPSR